MHLPRSVYPFLLSAFLWTSCDSENADNQQQTRLPVETASKQLFDQEEAHHLLQEAFTSAGADSTLAHIYAGTGFQPVWVADQGVSKASDQLIAELDSLSGDGLSPDRYSLSRLQSLREKLGKESDLATALAFDTTCTRAYLKAAHDLLFGVVNPKAADSLWFHRNDTSFKAPASIISMAKDGNYLPLNEFRSRLPEYFLLREEYNRMRQLSGNEELRALQQQLHPKENIDRIVPILVRLELPWFETPAEDSVPEIKRALQAIQYYHGYFGNGKADSTTLRLLSLAPDSIALRISANMERLRWLPQTLEQQYVLVNVPLMELSYKKGTEDAFNMRVVVGKPSRQTPSLNAMMKNVVFSPSWGVPPTILKKDVLPGFNRSGAAYLRKKGLHVYDRHGRQVNAGKISATNLKNYTLKQPPGARNALGEVKFNLPNRWDIYLHDTPHREDFDKRYRAKSSGCVRVAKPREFAAFILQEIEGRERFSAGRIDSIIQTRKTRYEQLTNNIPVHIVYLTAGQDTTGNHFRLLPDIYHRDNKLISLLAQ